MRKQIAYLIGLLVFIFLISSCSQLRSKYYAGEKEAIPTKEVKKETIWQYDEDVYYVRLIDSLTVTASSLKWVDSKKSYQVNTFDVVFSKLADARFLNIKGKDDLYSIFRMAGADDGTIAFFTVNEDFIKEEIKQGHIKATVHESEYRLEVSKAELDEYVTENINDLFKIKTPGIIKPLVDITVK